MSAKSIHRIALPALPSIEDFAFDSSSTLNALKRYLAEGKEAISLAFSEKIPVRYLIKARSDLIDRLLKLLWHSSKLDESNCSMVAVGGYGRAELHPESDIDLLFLIEENFSEHHLELLQKLITLLWDTGLHIGHSVRTVAECVEQAKADITIATNLIESRLLSDNGILFETLLERSSGEQLWTAQAFYEAKVAEQKERYRKYKGSSFDLEPNLKRNPGGLRDIQLVGWIAKIYFKTSSLQKLTNQGVFSLKEYRTLMGCQYYLWRIRFALHLITGKGDDRLLFQHQKSVAEFLGFQDKPEALAVEQLMRKYFRASITIRNVTELLLQVFEEVILEQDKTHSIEPIDEFFQLKNDRISLIDPDSIKQHPELILKTFIVAAKQPGNKHVSAKTLRAIRDHRDMIDDSYRNDPNNKQLFLEFFSIKHTGDRPFFLLKRNGVLAMFVPLFEKISGQMQFDMFHSYTVDEHTLFLLKNLTRFANEEYSDEFPYCSKIMQNLKKPQLIFLAGLFHDIAKGRGGDHSVLGAKDAFDFCINLGMPEKDAELVSWLVNYHLMMSVTAQKKDISDPKVIAQFGELVKTQQRLNLLYMLTVADIRATSPKLWNSWKDALLRDLYLATSAYLAQTEREEPSTEQTISDNKQQAKELLTEKKVSAIETKQLWKTLSDSYFKTTPVDRIVWQTESIIKHAHGDGPLVEIRRHRNNAGTEVFVYSPDQPGLFAAIAASLSQKNCLIQTADLVTNSDSKCLDSFVVLEESGQPIQSSTRIQSIRKLLQKNLKNIQGMSRKVKRVVPSRIKQFNVPTHIKFFEDSDSPFTGMEITALDQPGLLAAIGDAIKSCEMSIHSARINTLGEKIEDVFYISTLDLQPLNTSEKQTVSEKIKQAITEL